MILQNKISLSKKKKNVLCGIQDTNLILLNVVLKSSVTIDRVSFKKKNTTQKNKCESVTGRKPVLD